jgi:translation initiation factor IF-2
MTNKALIEKIQELEIKVKSHMSSLEDETVAKIKDTLFGTKPKEIEETRVKPTVIRRRKKVVRRKKTEKAEAAAEEPVADSTAEEIEVAEAADTADMPEKKEAVDAEGVAEEKGKEEEEMEPDKKEAVVIEEEVPEKPVKEEVVAEAKPKKKAKKKESPAKIIKLPVKPKEKPGKKEPVAKVKEGKKAKAVVTKIKPEAAPKPPAEKEISRKKKRKKGEEFEKDKKFFKKKISFRKKAVVEGDDLYMRGRRGKKGKKHGKGKVAIKGLETQITTPKAIKRRIKIDDTIVLSDLARRMGIKAGEMIKALMGMGVMATVNQTIDFDTAVLVASEFDYEVERASFEEETLLKTTEDRPDQLVERPPVVTIMGHVDHGKTSLLDVIRKTKITELEAGGITQHIGAYHVSTDRGQIAFLDTPGHEAFTAMRARGATITDLVILVVAADDGVKPQTLEAINHCKAADVPIIVAVNKIDKPGADPEKVKRELAEVGITSEDWGGDHIFVNVSAKQNEGIDELLEMVLLQAEVLELKANPDKLAIGYVVEAKIDSGRGAVATVLVQEGTLKTGDPVVCGVHHGKIRAMINDRRSPVESAGPSIPVEVLGLSGVPMAGDELIVLTDEKDAKQVSLHRIQKQRAKELAKTSRLSLEKLYERMRDGEVKDLNLIIKADVHGSIEALTDSLLKLSNEEVQIKIVHSATGTITESDVSLAAVSNAIIIGFNVRPSVKVQAYAKEESVDMRFYSIIYNVTKDISNAIVGMMESTFEERVLGRAEIREIFMVPKVGAIAGSYVTDGRIERGQLIRVIRDGVVLYEGKNSSLRRFKDDVREVQNGYECGIGIENYNDIKVGDILECYYLEEIKPELK